MTDLVNIKSCLIALYGEKCGNETFEYLGRILEKYSFLATRSKSKGNFQLSERDAILITYGDQVSEKDTMPLCSLTEFCEKYVAGLINSVHILPFYPYSSDDGFSVIDYRTVNPALGTWNEITRLGQNFRLMFDAVVNHISCQSNWFQGFLQDAPQYKDYFIVVEGNPDLSSVFRPRALPLLTNFDTPSGEKTVWTTFNADQVDLNYHNPKVLLAIIDLLLFYVSHGAEFIRLDAIAFLWKEIGTACLHLPQTHTIIQIFRAVLDIVAPHVMLIAETNVPHQESITYFGDGNNEAQLIYNFALPPLVLHTLQTGNSEALSKWASGLSLPSSNVTFLNFLASHDGIGITAALNILSAEEVGALIQRTQEHGGKISYRNNADGSYSPYELNINFFDALSNPKSLEPLELQVSRFITAQAIMLAVIGVPGIYFHSLFGSHGWHEGMCLTGQSRTMNRQKCERAALEIELANTSSLRSQVYNRYTQLLKARAASPAFHPHARQQILDTDNGVFAFLRLPKNGEPVVCLHNVKNNVQNISLGNIGADDIFHSLKLKDLITGSSINIRPADTLIMQPYQVLWLERKM